MQLAGLTARWILLSRIASLRWGLESSQAREPAAGAWGSQRDLVRASLLRVPERSKTPPG